MKNSLQRILPFLSLVFVTLLALPAFADGFVPIPETKDLGLKIVRYDGGTNGEMIVEVQNSGKKAQSFDAHGIFFVPIADTDEAPQRLGASGPFTEVRKNETKIHAKKINIAAGKTVQLRLEVFCIDSHRASPTSETPFRLAKNKLPKSLRKELAASNEKLYRQNKGDLKKAKSAIQKNMWKNRDDKWIPVEGEGAQEATK